MEAWKCSNLKTRDGCVRERDCQLTEHNPPVILRPKSLLLRQRFATFTTGRQNGKKQFHSSQLVSIHEAF